MNNYGVVYDKIERKMVELDDLLAKPLNDYGFKRKRKYKFVWKHGDCLQHIIITETKVRGVSQVHIKVHVGFKYEKVDKAICFMKNIEYEAKWATASINVDTLMDSKVSFGIYVNESTELEPIVLDIFHVVEKYAFSFLNSCDTLQGKN